MLRAILWCAVSTEAQTDDDKYSLPQQIDDEQALCAEHGWQVTEVLTVPGHSRRYIDIHELAADARAKGIDAFDRILDLWRRKAFDILICRDGDRFARTQALHAYFVEMTIDIGARIYSLADGWIDQNNYRMWTSMSGYKSASHVDGLVKGRRLGMKKRMQRGLNGGLTLPDLYRIVRDESGKAQRLEFREKYRSMMDDAAELLLEGVGWKAFAVELFQRYGHSNPNTHQPYHDNTFYRWFYNPICWGVTAMGYANKQGAWAFDENEPLPKGVEVIRDTKPPIPAIWTGEKAEAIKAELRRRIGVVKGRARSKGQFALTGLIVCDSCGRRMAVDNKDNHLYWRCSSHTRRHQTLNYVCTNRRLVRNDVAQEQINEFLVRLLAQKTFDFAQLTNASSEIATQQGEAANQRSQIEKLKADIDKLIVNQLRAPQNVQDIYATQIEDASQRLSKLEIALKRSESNLESVPVRKARQMAYEQLASLGLEDFWQCSPLEVNQVLHGLMGRYKFVALDGEIIEVRKNQAVRG